MLAFMSLESIMDQIGMPNFKYRMVYALANDARAHYIANLVFRLARFIPRNHVRYYVHGKENLSDEGYIEAVLHECCLDWLKLKMDSIDHVLVGASGRVDKTTLFFTMDHFFDGKSAVAAYNDKTGQIPFYAEHSEVGHIKGAGMRMNIEAFRLAKKYSDQCIVVFESLATDPPETEPSDLVVRVALYSGKKIIPTKVFTWPELSPEEYLDKKARVNPARPEIKEIHVIFGEPIDVSSCKRSEIPMVGKRVWGIARNLRPPGEKYIRKQDKHITPQKTVFSF